MSEIANSEDLLERLIAFPTISAESNLQLIHFCRDLLEQAGCDVTLIGNEGGTKANLFAWLGPRDRPGVLLSGHTDVVPVEGQDWSVAPFEMSRADGRLYGRGTTDMKGFVASALRIMQMAATRPLETPLCLALSYDEEIGCVGVRSLIEMLEHAPFHFRFCIVGEPTSMQVAIGHKGKTAARLSATGQAAHSALAPTALNAIHMACDMIGFLRELQAELEHGSRRDDDYDIAYSTIHVGTISGGTVLNIVPDRAEFMFEIRNLADDDPEVLLDRINGFRTEYLARLKGRFPGAALEVEVTNAYPSLATDPEAEVVRIVKNLTRTNHTIKVAFGTEGGLFSTRLNVPTIICGPGSMEQGHKPDEFLERDQLRACDQMLEALLDRLVDSGSI